jgi:hypothetical protein
MFSEPRAFVPDLDCVPVVNVAYGPTGFKHDPCHGLRRMRRAALRDFHPIDKDEKPIPYRSLATQSPTLRPGFSLTL